MIGPRASGNVGRRVMPGVVSLAALTAFCALWLRPLGADTVVLRAGGTLVNVVTVPAENGTLVIFRTGQVRKLADGDVLRVRIGPVSWPPGLSGSAVNQLVEERVSEFLRREKAGKSAVSAVGHHREQAGTGGFLWRSALIPGWGQWSAGRTTRGLGFFAASLGSALIALHYRGERSAAEADFEAAVLLGGGANLLGPLSLPASFLAFRQGRRAEERTKSAEDKMNAALLFSVLSYGWNLLDAGYLRLGWQPHSSNKGGASFGQFSIGIGWNL